MGLFDARSEAEAMRDLLSGVGVTPDMIGQQAKAAPARAAVNEAVGLLNIPMPEAPQTWEQKQIEKDGTGKFLGKQFLNALSGGWLENMIFPDAAGAKERYAIEAANYKDLMGKKSERDELMGYVDLVNNGVDDGQADILARTALVDKLGTLDKVNYALTGDQPGVKPNFVTIDNNGEKWMFDQNNPNSPGIRLTTPDGKPISSPLSQAQTDNIGAFDRMVPRLQELDEMEQAGVSIARETMSKLRTYETKEADGTSYLSRRAWQEWVDNDLTPTERKYILAAEDAGMITLRDESGAAISAGEILRQMNQYLMFNDYDDDTFEAQRNARNRKAKSLLTGTPDGILIDRKDQLDWVNGFKGARKPKPAEPTVVDELMPSTNAPVPYRPAPQAAVDLLQKKPELAKDFMTKFGYLPEGY